MRRIFALAAVAVLGLGLAAPSGAVQLVDFNGLVHGEIINTQYSPFVTFRVENFDATQIGDNSWGMAFNSELNNIQQDYDLLRDPDNSQENRDAWKGGNLNVNTNMGNVMAISQEWATQTSGVIDSPNDENRNPAGKIHAIFAADIFSIGFDMVDFEEYQTSWIRAYDNNVLLGQVNFADFIARDGAVYGDATINRVGSLFASDFLAGATTMDRVEWEFGGSGAIDNVLVGEQIPEPGTMTLLGLGLAAGAARLRRRRNKN